MKGLIEVILVGLMWCDHVCGYACGFWSDKLSVVKAHQRIVHHEGQTGAYCEIVPKAFTDVWREFTLVSRDMEWCSMDFASEQFSQRQFYFSDIREGVRISLEDPSPHLDLYLARSPVFEVLEHDDYIKSLTYSFYVGVLETGGIAFRQYKKGTLSVPEGNFPREFKMDMPPTHLEWAYRRHSKAKRGTLFKMVLFGQIPSRIFSKEEIAKIALQKAHLAKLAPMVKQHLSEFLLQHIIKALHDIVGDYFLSV